jgi:DNA-binding transcriptional LysR family regulator
MSQQKTLPPLDYLLAFEATAKSGSFVGASKSLNISETAISRKVKLLESHYNTDFLKRSHRSISLTPKGQNFLADISPVLENLRSISNNYLQPTNTQPVTIAATNSVATFWLMPRLQKFQSLHEQAKIMLISSDDDHKCLSDTNDLAILRGEGLWPGFNAHLLFTETVFPVCSPQYLEANPDAQKLECLSRLSQIEVSSNHTEWMNWGTWLSHFSLPNKVQKHVSLFNTFPLAMQAAVDGLGIALGWAHLVDPLLQQGKLVRPISSHSVSTNSGYYLLKNLKHTPFKNQKQLASYLSQTD